MPINHLARLDAAHGAPDYDYERPAKRQPCPVCGGPAPTSPEDSSHDDCATATDDELAEAQATEAQRMHTELATGVHVPLHVQREQRIAATLARRGTPEWRAGGAHLVAERAQAAADRAHRRAEAAMQARLQAERNAPVADAELHQAIAECEAAVADAARDLGTTPEDTDVWHDVVVNQLANYRPALAAEVRRCML